MAIRLGVLDLSKIAASTAALTLPISEEKFSPASRIGELERLRRTCRSYCSKYTIRCHNFSNQRPRPSLPCPDACNLAPVFNHGVLLLLCGGSGTLFFSGPRVPRPPHPSWQRSYDQGRQGVELRATGEKQYARKCDSRTPKTGSGCLELPMVGIRAQRQQGPQTNRLGYCGAVARPLAK
jgi:hypothetical protein